MSGLHHLSCTILLVACTPAAAALLTVGAPTMTKTDKKSSSQSLAKWKLFTYNPTTGNSWGAPPRAGV